MNTKRRNKRASESKTMKAGALVTVVGLLGAIVPHITPEVLSPMMSTTTAGAVVSGLGVLMMGLRMVTNTGIGKD